MFHPDGPTFLELARQALSSTERGYDLLAPKFDFTPFRTPQPLLDAVAPLIGPPQSIDAALDVCCGTGAAMRMLLPLCRQQVLGIDFSGPMMLEARRRLRPFDERNLVHFVRGNVLAMPLADCFDVAVCFGALGHILPREQRAFVAQVRSVLKPGGRFIFATARLPPRTSSQYWLSRGFNAAMHVRNWIIRPPFIMYYLTFLLPEASQLLEAADFEVVVHRDVFAPPFTAACLVVATRR